MNASRDILRKLAQVEEGDYLLWNGRAVPQEVVEGGSDESTFEIEGNRGGRYQFSRAEPSLLNLNSEVEYEVEELTVLRPVKLD
ncbi:hypothetical protein SAMN04488063_1765 [Halopelagius inordinatus]|uniref:Uncharacterized protein n=1 Tax=Halopelagius inordinatus TaxID=553467 RepID=A0A1I2RAV4_9EURY|nr:hypothetical protein [Halopelagius inordinatus]SFG34926.1 hypothetical protein SAMN04488063_1765 [Halopelagius inordinatus]